MLHTETGIAGMADPVIIRSIRARLHPGSGRAIGRMWSSQWSYPQNDVFDTSVSSLKLTLYQPGGVVVSGSLTETFGCSTSSLNALLETVGDQVYILDASVANGRYGAVSATGVKVTGVEKASQEGEMQ